MNTIKTKHFLLARLEEKFTSLTGNRVLTLTLQHYVFMKWLEITVDKDITISYLADLLRCLYEIEEKGLIHIWQKYNYYNPQFIDI